MYRVLLYPLVVAVAVAGFSGGRLLELSGVLYDIVRSSGTTVGVPERAFRDGPGRPPPAARVQPPAETPTPQPSGVESPAATSTPTTPPEPTDSSTATPTASAAPTTPATPTSVPTSVPGAAPSPTATSAGG